MRKWLIVLMAVVAVGVTGIMGWLYVSEDRKGPEITIAESKKNSYTADMTTNELLEGVTATDEKDGDVSDSLTVENVYPNERGDEVTVVYVAKDRSNNVTKVTYHMTSDGSLPAGTEEDAEGIDEQAAEASDTEEQDQTEADVQNEENTDEADAQDAEAEDTELTEEEKAQEREEAKIDKLNPQDPRFYLTTYYVEIDKGTQLDQLSYVKSIEDDKDQSSDLYRKIQITGNVDVNTPGTYELTYYVVDSNGNASNGAVLTVVVK